MKTLSDKMELWNNTIRTVLGQMAAEWPGQSKYGTEANKATNALWDALGYIEDHSAYEPHRLRAVSLSYEP